MEKKALVKIREGQVTKAVRITSDSKPEIFDDNITKWQSLIDTLARILDVPSGLIMRLNEDSLEVFLKSNTVGNPYKVNEKAPLLHGLYCETVVGTQNHLIVADATKNELWQNNPDVELKMISYMGVPINWPDGECFGTVCVLDNKENYFNSDFLDLINQIKLHIELDLQFLITNNDLKELNALKTKFISVISHDIRGNMGTIHQFLQLITSDIDAYDAKELKESLISLSQISSSSYNTLDNLLRWLKNDLTKLEPDIQPVDIKGIIEEVLAFFKLVAEHKSIEISTSIAGSAIVRTDRNMITTIMRNITSNAVKFNKVGGKIAIGVKTENLRHIITIEDTGKGMSADDVNKLFGHDVNQTAGTSGESGSGIGLLLVKDFVDKLGATITVESILHKGTIFTIAL